MMDEIEGTCSDYSDFDFEKENADDSFGDDHNDNVLSNLLGVAVTPTVKSQQKNNGLAATANVQMAVEQALKRVELNTVQQVEAFLKNIDQALSVQGKSAGWARLLSNIWKKVNAKMEVEDIRSLNRKFEKELSARREVAKIRSTNNRIERVQTSTRFNKVSASALLEELEAEESDAT